MAYPKVSIVIPSYNHAAFIEAAMRSADGQTYENLEIIVVDDGSTDDSLQVIERAGRALRRSLTVVGQRNRGAAPAINRGLRLATGHYVNVLNSDDLFSAERIEMLVDRLERSHSDLAFTKIACIGEDGRETCAADESAAYFLRKQAEAGDYPSVGFALLDSNIAISSGNIFAARSLVQNLRGFRPMQYCHDWDFLLRALCLTEPVFVEEVAYFYRLHGGNTFRRLGHRADLESARTLRTYFRAVRRGRLKNPQAPAPGSWPGQFEQFVAEKGYQSHLAAAGGLGWVAGVLSAAVRGVLRG